MLIIPFLLLFSTDKNLGGAFFGILVFWIIFLPFSWIFAKAFLFIPVIFGNPNYNYVLNAVLHFITIFILSSISKKNTEKKLNIVLC